VIQIQVLSGKLAGRDIVIRQFPFSIGRAAGSGLQLEEAGVWDRHLEISFAAGEGIAFTAQETALTLVNGAEVRAGLLRNGDRIELGSVRLQFWLARSEQTSVLWRECLIWCSLFGLFVFQLVLIVMLLR
jgi:pSer/pThr/pTyr-binding forkhead associated (FHA) protein